MNIIFWMEDPHYINVQKDTTYSLIHECFNQNNQVYYASKSSFSIHQNHLVCNAFKIHPFKLGGQIQYEAKSTLLNDQTIDVIWIRCDPPVNQDYIYHMLMFNQFKDKILFLNDPEGILKTNEKLSVLNFNNLIPPTMVTKTTIEIQNFINIHESIIVKPIDGFGGAGIFKFNKVDTNMSPAIDLMTKNETEFIVIQKAVDHTKGDKRVFCINGDPLGAVLRQSKSSHLNNLMAGASAYKTTLSKNDITIVKTIKPYLLKHNLFFVGIDIIDGYLIEINVTSPTCIQEFNQLNNCRLEKDIIDLMNQKIVNF